MLRYHHEPTVLNLAFALSVMGFLIMHISLVAGNTTTIEVTSFSFFSRNESVHPLSYQFSWCWVVSRHMRRKRVGNGGMTLVERKTLNRLFKLKDLSWYSSEYIYRLHVSKLLPFSPFRYLEWIRGTGSFQDTQKKTWGECRSCRDLNTLPSLTLIPSNADEEDDFDHHHVKQQYVGYSETLGGAIY